MGVKKEFVHLHLHSQYSLLDGACHLERIIEKTKALDMKAVAITDHGNMFGVIDFYILANSSQLKPIIGVEFYEAPTSRFDKSQSLKSKEDTNFHLVALAKDNTGYKNLLKLVSLSYLEGFYYKPRIDLELLQKYKEGLIILSGCLKGRIPKLILEDKISQAYKTADDYYQILGKGNFYLELMDTGLKEQKKVNSVLLKISKDLGIPLVATNDVHYIEKEDAFSHEVLLCIQTQTTLTDPKRMRFGTDEFYFKSAQEMWSLFKDIPESLNNTLEIAERCNVEIEFSELHLPNFPVPSQKSPFEFLKELCYENLEKKFPKPTPQVLKRLEYELEVIKKTGFAGYFLIIWDLVKFAKENNIPTGPGRGSAAGSLVSYLLGITEINPLEYGLLFERFLNPERVSMPDIDIDFCDEKRPKILEYVASKYGKENVAQIITFGTLQARAVVRDVGRVLGLSYSEVDRIAKLIPSEPNISLDSALQRTPQLRALYESDPKIRQLIDIAKKLEGLSRHASIHAAGVVISDKPLTDYIPLYKTSEGEITTGFSMGPLEKLGLLKMDFLGLKTLTLIEETLRWIKKLRGIDLDIKSIPLDDKKTYELLSAGKTIGVFQLESSGMRDLLRRLKPEKFTDLIHCLALYRPGPIGTGMVSDFIERKHGRQPVSYLHPKLEPVLKETYGIIVYQEQVMKIASELAGFSLAEADILRRAISKKIPEEMEAQRKKFIEGCIKNGIPEATAVKIFDLMEYFAGYGFNKSHSTAYALISYRTAYLKANFCTEFMCSLLNSEKNNTDKLVEYITEAKNLGIEILPPDINESYADFTVTGSKKIRFGLMAVKNVGKAAVEAIISARNKDGKFKSLKDFCQRVVLRTVNRKVIESLIKCGAFDSLGAKRSQLMSILDKTLESASKKQKNQNKGQLSLFSFMEKDTLEDELPEIEEWPQTQLLNFEKELLGFFVTGHPLSKYQLCLKKISTVNLNDVYKLKENEEITVGGILEIIKITSTRQSKEQMAILKLETPQSQIEVFAFPKVYQEFTKNIRSQNIVVVKGKVNFKEDEPKLIADKIFSLEEFLEKIKSLDIILNESNEDFLKKLKSIFIKYPGNTEIYFHFNWPELRLIKIKVEEQRVRINESLLKELSELIGEENFSLTL